MSKTTMDRFKINEIFYSLQGEGFFTGTPAVFVRFSGCNLHCPFCDTDHSAGELLTLEEIADSTKTYPARHIVLTGGEPSLFITEELVGKLKDGDRLVAIETNGTHSLPKNIDWITLSPKFDWQGEMAMPAISRCNELKVVFQGQDLNAYNHIEATHRFLQPCFTGDPKADKENIKATIAACLDNPRWRLSLQTHRILSIR